MICPVCQYDDTKVIDSRVAPDGMSIRRRRECLKCSFRFSTYEQMEILDLTVIKRDGRKEAYSRDKMTVGLRKALEKRPVTEDQFKNLVTAIEMDVQRLKQDEVGSKVVGHIVMENLRAFDQVAYIRFASVYQSFDNIQSFTEELKKLSLDKE